MTPGDSPRDLAAWLGHIERLHPRGQAGIRLGLDRVLEVRHALGHRPHGPVITVGGTNGKGSTCAFLEAILGRAGYRAGVYSSPHLLRYNERVRICGVPVADAPLAAAFARVEAARIAAGTVDLTYFEFGTLAAWEVMADAGVDVAILEVGLGGRLDAVNAYDPDVAIVTGVAIDHVEYLGHTREAIGFEKAGIFRPATPALCADPEPPASLIDHAGRIGADLRLLGRDFGYTQHPDDRAQWLYWCRSGDRIQRRTFAYPGLRGGVQLRNAAVALAALEVLSARLSVPMQAKRGGLIEAELPGRFQVIPGRPAVVLDVAHNPQAAAVLAANLGGMGFFERSFALVGILADKDVAGTLSPLVPAIDRWLPVGLDSPRAERPERLAEVLGGLGAAAVEPAESVAAALDRVLGEAGETDRILVFGSFHTVAAALVALGR